MNKNNCSGGTKVIHIRSVHAEMMSLKKKKTEVKIKFTKPTQIWSLKAYRITFVLLEANYFQPGMSYRALCEMVSTAFILFQIILSGASEASRKEQLHSLPVIQEAPLSEQSFCFSGAYVHEFSPKSTASPPRGVPSREEHSAPEGAYARSVSSKSGFPWQLCNQNLSTRQRWEFF